MTVEKQVLEDYMDALDEAEESNDSEKRLEAVHSLPDSDFMRGLQEAYDRMAGGDLEKAREITKQIASLPTSRDRSIAYLVREWVMATPGWFRLIDLYNAINIREYPDKQAAMAELLRLKKKGWVEKHRSEKERWRKREREVEVINWRNASTEGIEFYMPFEIHTFVNLFWGNIITIAGEKSAGKTSICLDIAKRNRDAIPTVYATSEMWDSELKSRLEKHKDISFDEWEKVKFIHRSHNVADVIERGCLNIVDFIELDQGKTFEVGDRLKEIHDALGGAGLAVVALQLDPNKDIARGGPSALDKPRLILTIKKGSTRRPGTIKIHYAKNFKGKESPTGKILHFKLVRGTEFMALGTWHYEDECSQMSCGEYSKDK